VKNTTRTTSDDDGDDPASAQEPEPIWLDWHEPEVADLTDQELADYVHHWRGRREGYLRKRRRVNKDHPDAYRWGYSAWWCSKKESIGNRETERRRIQREIGTRP
jgi:hypothetical protein